MEARFILDTPTSLHGKTADYQLKSENQEQNVNIWSGCESATAEAQVVDTPRLAN